MLGKLSALDWRREREWGVNRFWDECNQLIREHDTVVETPSGKVQKLILMGYLEINNHGVLYRSVPGEYGFQWISWNPFRIVNHFSFFNDKKATIRYVENDLEIKCEKERGE